MPDLDDLIRDHLERSARPPLPDPKLFHGIDRRRAQRATRRRTGSVAMAIVILALFAGVAFALSRSSGGVPPATQSTSPSVGPVSPNGAIVYVSTDPNGNHSLWSITSAGSQTRLTSGPNDLEPAVNPAGDTVAFSRAEGKNGAEGSGLYTVPIGGGQVSRILDAPWFATDPTWSPNGTKIAFSSGGSVVGVNMPGRAFGIYVMSADGSGLPVLLFARQTGLAVAGHPSWSPNGFKLVFEATNAALSNPPNFDLYVINADGTGSARNITNSPESETNPAWSPDGRRIAFSVQPATAPRVMAKPPNRGNIATIAVDGSGRVLLTDLTTLDVDPAWSPDGSSIVFARINQGGAASYILEVSTTGRAQTISTGINGGDPFWQKASSTASASARPAT